MTEQQSLTIDAARGVALVAGRPVAVADSGARGELRIGGPDGPVLRPLTFSQRWRVLRRLDGADVAPASVAAAIAHAALVAAPTRTLSDEERWLVETLALALAGAALEAPGFVATLLLVSRATGWSGPTLVEMEAAEVDQLAQALAATGAAPDTADAGWTTLRLVPALPAVATTTDDGVAVVALRDAYAERLLRRARATLVADEQPSVDRPDAPLIEVARGAPTTVPPLATAPTAGSLPVAAPVPVVLPAATETLPSSDPGHRLDPVAAPAAPARSPAPTTSRGGHRWQIHGWPAAPAPPLSAAATGAPAAGPTAVTAEAMAAGATAAVETPGTALTVGPPVPPITAAAPPPASGSALAATAGLAQSAAAPSVAAWSSQPQSAPVVGDSSATLAAGVVPGGPLIAAPPLATTPLAPPSAIDAAVDEADQPPPELSLTALLDVAEALATLLADESRLRGVAR